MTEINSIVDFNNFKLDENTILYSELNFIEKEHEVLFHKFIKKICYVSKFVAYHVKNNTNYIYLLVDSGFLFTSSTSQRYTHDVKSILSTINNENDLFKKLRNYRNREMVRIAWRDIASWANIEETMMDITNLAEACINETLDYLFIKECQIKSIPVNSNGEIQKLNVVGMGKIGAWELNFSSDVDLIFFYEDDGVLNDRKGTSYMEFYTKLVHRLIHALDTITEDGFVFRVDTRLRPFGESGPLVLNFEGMENYYQGHAREWERYAMVKARVLSPSKSGDKLQSILTPFIYRKYLDFRAFGELRQLKKKITTELQRKDSLNNIKLGPGGIREIEFIGQAFQLIRGGSDKSLRERSIQRVLDVIARLGYLPIELIDKLKESYRFLRLVENRLQQYDDKQTHELPTNVMQRHSLTIGLGFSNWEDFQFKITDVRRFVHEVFSQVVDSPQAFERDEHIIDWTDADITIITEQLIALGYSNLDAMVKLIYDFQNSYAVRQITTRGSAEINRLIPLILQSLVKTNNPVETLSRILKLMGAIAGRNVYFTLLVENPLALSQLVKLSSTSSWIIDYISFHPVLLDELLDPRNLYAPFTRERLKVELDYCLSQIDEDDVEQLLVCLRQFKQTNVLRIAIADLIGKIPIILVSEYLTWLAEILVNCVLQKAWMLTSIRHGFPESSSLNEIKGFGIIAYGKLGGKELGYSSDLDLVFLYGGVHDETLTNGQNPITCAQFFSKVVKRIVMILTTQIHSGILYAIDLRLRPSGHSGLLVSSLDAYEAYQLNQAWTWEQQALVRTRFIAGDPIIATNFNDIRRKSLCRSRDGDSVRRDVLEMRSKMRDNLEIKLTDRFDLKQSSGGIADIEFIVQCGVLIVSHDYPEITERTDVMHLLENLCEASFITQDESVFLREAYCLFREQTHRSALLEQSATASEDHYREIRSRVRQIWRDKIEH